MNDELTHCYIGNPAKPGPIRMKVRYVVRPSWDESGSHFLLWANNTNTFPSQTKRLAVSIPHTISARVRSSVEVEPKIISYFPLSDGQRWDYSVYNNGPSTIGGRVLIEFPVYAVGGDVIIHELDGEISLYDEKSEEPREQQKCNIPPIFRNAALAHRNAGNEDAHAKRDKNGFRIYDCGKDGANLTDLCVQIECKLREEQLFRKSQRIEVHLKSKINDAKFQNYLHYKHSKFTPKFTYEMNKVPYSQMNYYDTITRYISSF